jgi:hypothetical protein
MERASSFTAVPGWGGVAMGASALVAAWVSRLARTPEEWLGIWLAEAFLAAAIGIWAIAAKARRSGVPLFAGPARRFLLTLSPPSRSFTPGALALEPAVLPGFRLLFLAPQWGGAFAVGSSG